MTWQNNTTMTAKSTKGSMFVEYNNLLTELEQYMPQFKATVKDLQEPSQGFVTNFYTDILSEFFCDVNNLTEIQVNQKLTYHEMYGETVPILNMCTALRYLYSKLGIDDFGLNDICDPSPKRTYRLLQTMINFIKYSDDKIHEAEDKMKAIKNMKDSIDKLKNQKNVIVNAINQKSLGRKHREAEMKTVADDLQVCKSELMNIQKHRDELLKELNKEKQEQEEVEKKYSKLCEMKDRIIRDINSLRGQIVESPDLLKADHGRLQRLKNEIVEKKSAMMAQISAKKQTILILEQELEAKEKRLRVLTDVTEKNQRLFKLNHEIEKTLQDSGELGECLETLKQKVEIMEHERADINIKIARIMEEIDKERNLNKSEYDANVKKRDDMLKQRNHQCEIMKETENQIKKCISRKEELKAEVALIMEEFELANNTLYQHLNHLKSETKNQLHNDIQLLESSL